MFDQLRMDGKVVLVTGGGRGIGRAIAEAMAEAGATVAITSRTQPQLDDVAAATAARFGRRVLAVAGDQTDDGDVASVVQRVQGQLGPIDVLVNNAGQPTEVPFVDMTIEAATALVDVNLLGPIRYLQGVAPGMIDRGHGKVINVASMDAVIGTPNLAVYGSTKGALVSLTKALAAEWARHGLHVNALCPGYIRTSANDAVLEDERVLAAVTRRVPLRRLGVPEDLGAISVFLASDASDFVTGASFHIDGGETAV